jgi:D-psicose/D-tagatose/L-ribulose 3-epimerase
MKLGMNLLLYTTAPDEKIFPVAEKLQQMGYQGLEWPVMSCDAKTAAAIGKFNKSAGLEATTVTVFGEGQNPISADASQREAARKAIEQAIESSAALGSKLLCGPIVQTLGHFSGHGPTKEEWDRCVEFLSKAGDFAKNNGVTLAVEYLNRFEIYFLNTAADARRLCDAVHHPNVHTMVDTFHANIEEASLYDAVMAPGPHLAHIHISENNRGIPGSSKCIQWEDFFRGLKDAKYDGWLTIEAFSQFLPDLAAAARIWRPIFKNPDDVGSQGIAFVKKMLESIR